MNPSDWRKAATLVTQLTQEAAMAKNGPIEQYAT